MEDRTDSQAERCICSELESNSRDGCKRRLRLIEEQVIAQRGRHDVFVVVWF